MSRMYDEKYNQLIQKVYDKMDFAITAPKDEIVDVIGYLGKGEFYREKRVLSEISEEDFIKVFYEKNLLKDVMFAIGQIDKDRTCVVTKNELDDILKIVYPDQLRDRNLMNIIG